MAVFKCTCKHEFQDKRYGKRMRVYNPAERGKWRCTVCRRER